METTKKMPIHDTQRKMKKETKHITTKKSINHKGRQKEGEKLQGREKTIIK